MFLEIHDLKKSFGEKESKIDVLKGLSFEIERGEMCVLALRVAENQPF